MISIDASAELVDHIRSSLYTGAVIQDPYNMGYRCVKAAIKNHNGKNLSDFIDSGFHWVNADNVDDPENGGQVGKLREIYAYSFPLFLPLESERLCEG